MELQALSTLTVKEYKYLLDQGLLWEFYPEATGEFKRDLNPAPKLFTKKKYSQQSTITISKIEYDDLKKIKGHYTRLMGWLREKPEIIF